MFKKSLPSIEQFAAFIDGNLSQSEMLQFSQLAEHDSALHQLLDASTLVDNTLSGFCEIDFQLPQEIIGSDFELPTISTERITSFIALSPEPIDDILVAACAYEDVAAFSIDNQDDNFTIGDDIHNDSSHLIIPENDSFYNGDALSDMISDDL